MRIYVGFDDTDTLDADRGTGKLARWFEHELPESCRMWGVVRQQLLIHDAIPYTSHNSAACVIVDVPDASVSEQLIAQGPSSMWSAMPRMEVIQVCVACEGDPSLARIIAFGRTCTQRLVTQREALQAASQVHLSGHGGTNDGIIGAAAAVGLAASAWCGRFIEFTRLRDFADTVQVSALEDRGIRVVSIDRDAQIAALEDVVFTKGWMRPRLLGNTPVLMVRPRESGVWESLGERRRKGKKRSFASGR